jgi:hypothetical protein
MPISAAEQAIIDRFKVAIATVATKMQALIDGSLEDAEFDTQLQDLVTGLEQLGAPSAPVPPPVA